MTNKEKIDEFILNHCKNCINKNTNKCRITINRKGEAQCVEEKVNERK